MKAAERQEQMKQYIQAADRVTVAELSGHWGITEETVRRDLDKLESQGSVTRVHGGAIWNGFVDTGGEHFVRRHKINAREKGYIALKAAEVIHPCETIIADASSTVLEALKAVGDERRLTVITNSSKICDGSFEPAYNLICTGGIYNWKSLSFQGESALESIRKYRVDLAILGCKALDLDLGVMDSYESEAVVKRVMVEQADKVAILADHTKFDKVALLKLMDLGDISYIITDREPSKEWVSLCRTAGVGLLY
ncbi:DeoR/GlpR family DNA-binding transcription regulator [Olsenella profusa]|uniref:Transcriptional regulator, DeoR family n=1 Tax=Olsenella profusa F0195 TaxID=1125712 RepID=U2TTR3_9ACTN|nr:DeoR/GlpR family DNA-binding transcription regulator [Olsenella profusa]ERL09468.1 transcriptional regulator, DeoR family [Olsenella profusa F0195]